jgi:small conductance mechanosensitive channel
LSLLLLLAAVTPHWAVAQPPLLPPADEAATPDADIETLLRILEDDEARARLVERLRAANDAADSGAPAPADQTFADRLATYTRGAAASAGGAFTAMVALVRQASGVLSGEVAVDTAALRGMGARIALLIAATFGGYLLLQLMLRRLQRNLAGPAASSDVVGRLKGIAVCAAFDIGTVLVAWGVGYVLALSIGRPLQAGVEQSLFLNAFLIIELTKAGSRTLLAPRWPALRMWRLDDTSAAYWYFWLSRLVSLVGYTFLFVAPFVAGSVSRDLADAVRVFVLFGGLIVAVAIILQNRDAVRTRLVARAVAGETAAFTRSLATIARIWHVIAIAYLIAVFGLWVTDPETALPFVLTATAQSLAAVVIGTVLSAFIARLASGGMRLSAEVKARLPLLEARLNAFIPNVLRVVRVVVTVAVLVTIAQAWHIADVAGWLSSDRGQRVVASLVSVALILLIGGVVYVAVQSWIEYRLNSGTTATPRERTLLALFRNAFTIVIGVLVSMLVLSEVGVNIGPLLAGAGVVGLAIGFGSQKLVQDVINGAFIQFEDPLNEGDVITAGGVTGVVERLTIRSVSLRSLDGAYHVIPFSSVDTVTNLMKHFSFHVAAIGVAYRENIADVKEAMSVAFERLKQTEFNADILGDFEMQGVAEFADSAVVVRARIMTLPGKQWGLGRAFNEILKEVFDERGIEIPFPHVTLYMGQNKDGSAPPLHVHAGGADPSAQNLERAEGS